MGSSKFCLLALDKSLWSSFTESVLLQDLFPFKKYFADAPGGLFKGRSYAADMMRARGCWRHLRTMFQELEECRAFELLKVRAQIGSGRGLFASALLAALQSIMVDGC